MRLKMRSCWQPANPPYCHPWEKGKQRTRCHQMAQWHLLCICSQLLGLHAYPIETHSPTGLGEISFCCPFKESRLPAMPQDKQRQCQLLFYTAQTTAGQSQPCSLPYSVQVRIICQVHNYKGLLLTPCFFLYSFVKTQSCHVTQPKCWDHRCSHHG